MSKARNAMLVLLLAFLALPLGSAEAKSASQKATSKTKTSKKHKATKKHKTTSKKAMGPSLKVVGLSLDLQDFKPGTHITEQQPVNACYYIFGEAATPSSMTFVALIEAKGISDSAPSSIEMTAPWTTQGFGEALSEQNVPFSEALFPDGKKSAGVVAGGGTSSDDYFRWIQIQGGSLQAGDGTYTVNVSTEVANQKLEAHGSITVDC